MFMDLIRCYVKGGNFGDDLNDYLWRLLVPNIENLRPSEAILGVGTLQGIDISPDIKKVHVFGSGSNSDSVGAKKWLNKHDFEFHFVRGPRTARQWNCEDKALTDGACLLMLTKLKDIPPTLSKKIGYIPHHVSDQFENFEFICELADIEYISPKYHNVPDVISKIKSCDYIISASLHGAIVADLFRKPWIPITSGPHIDQYKWNDWCESIKVKYNPHPIDLYITRNMRRIVRFENIFKRLISAAGLGKERWKRKRVLYDSKDSTYIVASQILNIIKLGSWNLSSETVSEDLISKANELWVNFEKRLT